MLPVDLVGGGHEVVHARPGKSEVIDTGLHHIHDKRAEAAEVLETALRYFKDNT